MRTCACGCGRTCQGQYARGHHPRSHGGPPGGAPSQAMVLDAIRRGLKSRRQIAGDLNVRSGYVGTVLDRLKKRGLVKPGKRQGWWEVVNA